MTLTDELQLPPTFSSQGNPRCPKGWRLEGYRVEGLASRLSPLGHKAVTLLVWPKDPIL